MSVIPFPVSPAERGIIIIESLNTLGITNTKLCKGNLQLSADSLFLLLRRARRVGGTVTDS